jgi:hypothetical protein
MSDRMHNPRPVREIPRFDGIIPDARSQNQHPRRYEPRQQTKRVMFLHGSWWVWLSSGIGLAVVAGVLFGGGGSA